MSRSNVEAKIKESSLAIMIISLIGAALTACAGFYQLLSDTEKISDDYAKKMMLKTALSNICSVILIIAAVIFYRIAKNARPFTNGNITAIRIIALLFLINAVLPSIIVGMLLGFAKISIIGSGSIFNAALCFFFGEILRYGNLLQTESDETL